MSIIEPVSRKQRAQMQDMRNRCRLGKHWMDTFSPTLFESRGLFTAATYILHWQCQRCGTVRHDGISANGGLLCRRYEYPDGYRLDTDEARPTSDELRMWMIKRDKVMGISAPKSKAKTTMTVSQQLKASARG